jgi:hypothetical protein
MRVCVCVCWWVGWLSIYVTLTVKGTSGETGASLTSTSMFIFSIRGLPREKASE